MFTLSDVSSGTHHVINPFRPSPTFRTPSDKSWAWKPANEARKFVYYQRVATPVHVILRAATGITICDRPKLSLTTDHTLPMTAWLHHCQWPRDHTHCRWSCDHTHCRWPHDHTAKLPVTMWPHTLPATMCPHR